MEDKREEELLQLLVGKVDAELLERVGREALESEDVEEADEELLRISIATAATASSTTASSATPSSSSATTTVTSSSAAASSAASAATTTAEAAIDARDHPLEEARVDGLGERAPRQRRLLGAQVGLGSGSGLESGSGLGTGSGLESGLGQGQGHAPARR